ncbi:LacI family DNA-binding transcriptional regulator [Aeromonas enteropelogenes]|uniref:LacI family DNA-binding transcriptional regulator n=1 Tax=Aeromonas enteropelogenes TaxID=29489 RepID=UPI00398921FE
MSVTFRDVAQLAGVSTQTVSRVINGADSVTPQTRERVNEAIKTLGYVPHHGAQMLSRGRAKTIGIVSLDIALHGAALIVNGIRQEAHSAGFATALSIVARVEMDNVKAAIRELISQQIELVMINVPLNREQAAALVAQYRQQRFMFIDVPHDARVNYVCARHDLGGYLAASHLVACKRARFLLITGPEQSSASRMRYTAWLEVLAREQKVVEYVYQGDWHAASGYAAVRDAINHKRQFDAILVGNDQMALGVLSALHEHAIQVPDDVAVTGFDNTSDSAYFSPGLTTISQDFIQLGQQAVRLMLAEQAQDQQQLIQFLLPVELVVRASTAEKLIPQTHKREITRLLQRIEALLD